MPLFGPQAKAALPALKECLTRKNEGLKTTAQKSIEQIEAAADRSAAERTRGGDCQDRRVRGEPAEGRREVNAGSERRPAAAATLLSGAALKPEARAKEISDLRWRFRLQRDRDIPQFHLEARSDLQQLALLGGVFAPRSSGRRR